MRLWVAALVAVAALSAARIARTVASELRSEGHPAEPFAPSPGAAPFLSLGFREAAADIFFVRLRGYFGESDNNAPAIGSLCEAIVALDPQFHRTYEYCGHAMTLAKRGVDQSMFTRAIAVLDRGTRAFPDDWRLPNLMAQMYTLDLVTKDPVQRRDWDNEAAALVESAVRKPGAPGNLADWAAVMRTRLGQHERAVQGLREMLLLTTDASAQRQLLARLAELERSNAEAIAAEVLKARGEFEKRWRDARPGIPPTWFVLLGPRLTPGFDMGELATGGRGFVEITTPEPLEPIDY